MKKRKSLVASLVAIVICFAMLLGTTYAWFTDSVINTNNIIKSGNVDVELYHTNKVKTNEKVDGTTKLFVNVNGDEILWEPGASTSESFTIKNEGSLALKYEFRVKALARTFTESGKALSEILTLKVTGEGENNTQVFGDGYTVSGNILAGKDAKYTVSISWTASENDNDYNVKEDLQILLGIELVATQYTVEEDGTGNQYDFDSALPDLSTYKEIDQTAPAQEVALETKGENPIKATVPAAVIEALPDTVTSIAIAHTEPIVDETNKKVSFESVKIVDQDGDVIDLKELGVTEKVTVTLPAQEVFAEGAMVDIYHDGEIVDTVTVGADGVITYNTAHFSEVAVGSAISIWDGTADTSWYNETDTEFVLNSAGKLAGLAKLIDGGNTFEGKTIKLATDVDLGNKLFDPIGSYRKDKAFKGTFDGKGHTISNLSQNTWELDNGYYYSDCGLGLFGAVEDGHIKNLVVDGADISGESALCGTIASVAHNATFENITIKNANVADYQYYSGGIVGWASGKIKIINCNIDESTTIGAQWGEFNNANGGVIGGASTSDDTEIYLEDCTIACRIDAFNDVTSAYEWYSYRRSGMIIGDTGFVDDPDGNNVGNAIAPQLTCKNVTVIYGDWANYHYCQFKNMGYPWVRVEAGTSTGEYSNPRYGHPTDANGNAVVDGNHVHNGGEKHNELLVFDQLYGGESGDRYCTYGTATHDGVTVIYNNK